MSEHGFLAAVLAFAVLQVSFVAATFLEARRVLSQYRP